MFWRTKCSSFICHFYLNMFILKKIFYLLLTMKWWISQGSWWSEGIYPYSFIRFKYSYSTCLIKKGSLISFYFNVFWFLKLGAAWHHSGKRGPSLPYKERDRSEDLRHAGGVYYGKWIHSNLCIIIRSWEVTKGESMKRLPWQQNAHYSM